MEESVLNLAAGLGVGLTLFFLLAALLWRQEDPIHARVESLRRGPRQAEIADLTRPFGDRVLTPALDAVADRILAALPAGFASGVRRKLVMAGEPINLGGYLAVTGGSIALFSGLSLALVAATASGFGVRQLSTLVGLTLIGALLPYIWLNNRVRARQGTIIRSLPDAFDLITTCVEAGLGLDAALARVAEKVHGPFAAELSRTLREIGLGRMRRDALKDLGERTGVPDLITFINAVIQAEQMGTSIGQVLRVQADQMRMRRRQRAEELAHQAPVKMTFPLVLCIFPTLFIVILGPAGIAIYDNIINK